MKQTQKRCFTDIYVNSKIITVDELFTFCNETIRIFYICTYENNQEINS